ncbi:BTAD domain-containing putative transcriptional regulator [Actinophytocola sp.]|uniref:AfsR/SARP family transcriptional regulator n=1 Tax=Actinophytocola sp. TaxID=1872138 RepID=UPI003D6C5AAE
MDFRILGSVEVWHDGALVPVTAPMQRAVLATLLVRAGETVAVESIVDQLWGPEPPHTAQVTIRNYVQRLRRVLPRPVLETVPPGYRLVVEPESVDATRFAGLVEQARAVASPDPVRAARLFDAALALWRGTPLADLGDVPMRLVHAPRLEEMYLGALEESFEVKLRLGWHARLVPELTELTGTYPLRERLCRQLMIALYRSRRSAEALGHYHRIRERLVEELGVEPGVELRRLQERILREDLTLSVPFVRVGPDPAPAADHPPAELPPPIATFVGRAAELDELRERFASTGPVACFVHGPAGAGKSTLAVRFAHECGDRFADGTLYVDLAGNRPGTASASPSAVLTALLDELGVPRAGTDPARAYRSRLHGRRMLVVLDNATNPSQVLPAIPDEPGCAALVTSRRPIAGPDGAVHTHVGNLTKDEAVTLLARIAGQRKVDAEPDAAAELARLCAYNPLALRIVATRATTRPHWPLASWVELLDAADSRLAELADVRASLLVNVRQLADSGNETERAAADLLARLPRDGREITQAAAAQLTGWPRPLVARALEELVDAQLLYSPTPGSYAYYGLADLL